MAIPSFRKQWRFTVSKLQEKCILEIKVLDSQEAKKMSATTKEMVLAKTKEGIQLYQIFVEVIGEKELPNGKKVKTTEVETIKSLFPLDEGTHWVEVIAYRIDKATYYRVTREIMPIMDKKTQAKSQ